LRGLTRGEDSKATNPVLQLFTRQGELLTDPVSGSFRIEQVANPETTPAVVVSPTALDLALAASGGHKLGTGRFLVPTGSTAGFAIGTHRVVYDYAMEAGGRTYTQVIEFEILDPREFPNGHTYSGLCSSRSLYRDGFFDFAGTPPDKLHRHISRESAKLEGLTERFFEPRFLSLKLNGQERPIFFVDEAVIAVEKIEAISRSPNSAAASTSLFDSASYRVFNRHLNGLLNPDDRYNPQISLVETRRIAGVTAVDGDFSWPFGKQNVQITGVFGFTDPDVQPDEVLIGHTPEDFVQIIGTLATRYLSNPDFSSIATWKPGLTKAYRTRDQQISFYGASGNVNYTGGLTGDSLVDGLLQRFFKPARLSYPDRDEFSGGVL
jgi:hypothetical protein